MIEEADEEEEYKICVVCAEKERMIGRKGEEDEKERMIGRKGEEDGKGEREVWNGFRRATKHEGTVRLVPGFSLESHSTSVKSSS